MTDATRTDQRTLTLRCQFCQHWNRVRAERVSDRPKCGHCGRPFLLDRPVKLAEDEFQRTIDGSQIPVLVDFYADWCGPCKVMAPVLDDFAARMQGRVLVAKVDTDRAQQLSQSLGIRGIPTLITFVGGRETGRHVGAGDRATLERLAGVQ